MHMAYPSNAEVYKRIHGLIMHAGMRNTLVCVWVGLPETRTGIHLQHSACFDMPLLPLNVNDKVNTYIHADMQNNQIFGMCKRQC